MDSLVALGFTQLEAAIYVFLLESCPSTGYQIAKAIEKPNSNTYQALESLTQRGVLLVDEGSPRRYRAVPYQEVLRQLEAAFQAQCKAASRDLDAIRPASGDSQVYRINNRGQVIERCRTMLHRARHKVLVDAFPAVLATISDELVATAARGVEVIAKVYEPIELPGIVTIRDLRGDHIPELWGVQWLNLVADGREHLYACLDYECRQVNQAIWTESPWVAFLFHVGLHSEMVVDEIVRSTRGTTAEEKVHEVIGRFSYGTENELPGRRDIIQGRAPEHEEETP
jgi:sugar-specific transcriptional regulator TrmB